VDLDMLSPLTLAFAAVISTAAAFPADGFVIGRDGSVEVGPFWYMTTCGQYARDRRLPPNVGEHASDRSYVAGWLSAYNALVSGRNIGGGDARLDDVLLWLDGYCLKSPFETIQNGLIEFSYQVAPTLPRN
jgi:hypothetical protein